MKKYIYSLVVFAMALMVSCSGGTDVVDSGTYKGEVVEVEPEKTEIYVKTEDNKKLELYFTDETTLTKSGQKVDFSALSEGTQVEVEVKKVGKRLDPVSVKILE